MLCRREKRFLLLTNHLTVLQKAKLFSAPPPSSQLYCYCNEHRHLSALTATEKRSQRRGCNYVEQIGKTDVVAQCSFRRVRLSSKSYCIIYACVHATSINPVNFLEHVTNLAVRLFDVVSE